MHPKPPIILLWFKRDLRVEDHAPLHAAVSLSLQTNTPIVAFYSFEPNIVNAPDFSDFHFRFIQESLWDLQKSLSNLGIPLCIFQRHISEVMQLFLDTYTIKHLFSHEETGNAITYSRDLRLATFLESQKISWTEFPTNGVVRKLQSRDTWSKIWDSRMYSKILPVPIFKQTFPSEIRSDSWQKSFQKSSLQKGWEGEWKKTLNDFLRIRWKQYLGGMSRPIEWQIASSRISPYLAYGCLSLRYVVQNTIYRMQELKGEDNGYFLKSLHAFSSRLHWHSHFIQKFESEPRMEFENVVSNFSQIRNQENSAILDAIESWNTGIPFIDATVRQLLEIGWINFRARATLVSFVCNTCLQPWQGRFAHWLARNFLDYEPGIHYSQLQMQAGTMGINTLRIYNPTKQLEEKDTTGKFIQRWIPELRNLPRYLQNEPWKISPMEEQQYNFKLGKEYPHPIVDVEQANREARKILYGLKKSIDPGEKLRILDKHGSRKNKNRSSTSPNKSSLGKSSLKKTQKTPEHTSTQLSLLDE
jgi:deoxyribodipyrimidine photo-lyase